MDHNRQAIDWNSSLNKAHRSTLEEIVGQRERRRIADIVRLFADDLQKPIALMRGSDLG
jgi:hypothetical protein